MLCCRPARRDAARRRRWLFGPRGFRTNPISEWRRESLHQTAYISTTDRIRVACILFRCMPLFFQDANMHHFSSLSDIASYPSERLASRRRHSALVSGEGATPSRGLKRGEKQPAVTYLLLERQTDRQTDSKTAAPTARLAIFSVTDLHQTFCG